MADESITRMNLSAIKKIDPYAKEIVDSSSHVAFYTFNSAQNEWEKTDVEGAFFIYHRNAEPFHSIFINNRLNTTSFVEPITGSLELQSQPPFLLYRNERSRIRGFWFYNSEECDRISGLVNGLLKSKDHGTNGQVQRHAPAPQDNNQPASIFNMLSKAQKDYKAQVSGGQPKTPLTENVTAGNVLKFFESAKQATADSLFHRVQPLSVDQLEKQQRAVTPGEDLLPSAGRDNHDSRLSPFQKAQQLNTQLLSELKIGKSFAPAQSPTGAPSSSALMANDDAGKCLRRLLAGDKPGPALMPPTMFDAPNNGNPEPQQPLNSTQFVQAFTYLIQNDKEFANKLHKAYLNGYSNLLLDSSPTYQ
ncbi:mRNA-decapping enzyme 1A [Drosophila subpulchrella]|uniref:mRNA-decapping enzyme 1A n=1 Tax=Drosophila subpulchrella TaxID=1486046 RepID=UPI0018A18A36|nr:mRNA-decapping enzyme 1A [Drosophila subpulchrella]